MQKNKINMADICELAHLITVNICKDKKIVVDKQVTTAETCYTIKAQHIFDYYYDLIKNTLKLNK